MEITPAACDCSLDHAEAFASTVVVVVVVVKLGFVMVVVVELGFVVVVVELGFVVVVVVELGFVVVVVVTCRLWLAAVAHFTGYTAEQKDCAIEYGARTGASSPYMPLPHTPAARCST